MHREKDLKWIIIGKQCSKDIAKKHQFCQDPFLRKCFCQTPILVLRLGVDFVLPLSQEEQAQEEQVQHEQPPPKSNRKTLTSGQIFGT